MKLHRALTSVLALAVVAGLVSAQDAPKKKGPASPPAETSATIGGTKVTIQYSAPSVKGRKIFGGAGALQPDNTVWRAGANKATALHTDGDITDRKSTRLNSSHLGISYAVFCLKKKKNPSIPAEHLLSWVYYPYWGFNGSLP